MSLYGGQRCFQLSYLLIFQSCLLLYYFQYIHYQILISIRLAFFINILEIIVFFQRIWESHLLFLKEKKATKLRPMLIISFFLLLFWQLKLFFRLLYSFWLWSHELFFLFLLFGWNVIFIIDAPPFPAFHLYNMWKAIIFKQMYWKISLQL